MSTNWCLKWRVGYINVLLCARGNIAIAESVWLSKNNFHVKYSCLCTTVWRGYSTRVCINTFYSLNGGVFALEQCSTPYTNWCDTCTVENQLVRGENLTFQTGFLADACECIIIWRYPLKEDWLPLVKAHRRNYLSMMQFCINWIRINDRRESNISDRIFG